MDDSIKLQEYSTSSLLMTNSRDTARKRLVDDPLWRHRGNPNYPDHDEHGFRNIDPLPEPEHLLTGSSHVYGTNLKLCETWPYLLQANGCRIFNASMGAWSPLQYALTVEKFCSTGFKQIVVGLYTGFDIYAGLKHSIETNTDFSKRFIKHEEQILRMAWRGRDSRDAYLAKCKSEGMDTESALEQARMQGFEDTHKVAVDGQTWWTEPELRLKTTDLDDPYISAAYNVSMRYLSHVKEQADLRKLRLVFLIMPTKETTISTRLTKKGNADKKLARTCESEVRLIRKLVQDLSCIANEVYDLSALYSELPLNNMFDNVAFEGHVNKEGASRIAGYLVSMQVFS